MEGRLYAKYSFLFVASSALVFAFFWTPPAGLVAVTKEASIETVGNLVLSGPILFRTITDDDGHSQTLDRLVYVGRWICVALSLSLTVFSAVVRLSL